MDKNLDKHIPKNFDTSNTADRAWEKLISSDAFMAPIAATIHKGAAKPSLLNACTKRGRQLKLQNVDGDAKNVKEKSLSPLRRTDWDPSVSPSDKDDEAKPINVGRNWPLSTSRQSWAPYKGLETLVNVNQIFQIGWFTLQRQA